MIFYSVLNRNQSGFSHKGIEYGLNNKYIGPSVDTSLNLLVININDLSKIDTPFTGIVDINRQRERLFGRSDCSSNESGFVRCLGILLAGEMADEVNDDGERIKGDTLLILFNAYHENLPFVLPKLETSDWWERILNTTAPNEEPTTYSGGTQLDMPPRSLFLYRLKEDHPE